MFLFAKPSGRTHKFESNAFPDAIGHVLYARSPRTLSKNPSLATRGLLWTHTQGCHIYTLVCSLHAFLPRTLAWTLKLDVHPWTEALCLPLENYILHPVSARFLKRFSMIDLWIVASLCSLTLSIARRRCVSMQFSLLHFAIYPLAMEPSPLLLRPTHGCPHYNRNIHH